MKRVISCVLSLCIALSVFTCTGVTVHSSNKGLNASTYAETAKIANDKIITENDNFRLIFNTENFLLEIEDKQNGFVWSSNFTDNAEDTVAAGIVRTDILSDIIVSYAYGSDLKTANSRAGSVLRNAATFKAIEGGVRIEYGFGDYGFTVPVEYVLESDGLKASVILKDIKEEKDNKIISVEMLPYLGSKESKTNSGYLFVPDGSGALITFENREYGIKQTYEKQVYGEDLLVPSDIQATYDEDIKIPVFGMKAGNNAFVAIIENGSENSSICAAAAGQKADCFSIGSKFFYRTSDYVDVTMQNGSKTSSLFISEPDSDIDEYTVKYTFLRDEKSDYLGMAEVYRNYLLNGGLEESATGSAKLFLDLNGGILMQTSFLGIPYKTVDVLTSFKQAEKIIGEFKEQGVTDIALGFKNFSNSSIKGKTEIKLDFSRKFGGKSALRSLLKYADENSVSVYPYADFFSFTKKGNGIGGNKTKVYSLEKYPAKLYDFGLADNYRVNNGKAFYFIRPSKYEYSVKKLIKSVSKTDVKGLGIGDVSSKLISDSSKDFVSRTDTKKLLLKSLDKLGADYGLMSYSANDYVWNYSEVLTDVPTYSSQYSVFDYDIPFLQIVLKGVKDYSCEALNLSAMSTESFLRAIESGSNLKFEGIYVESLKVKGTQLSNIFGANYKAWFDTAVNWYKETQKISELVKDSTIVAHTVYGELSVTEYENGVKTYVNYSDTDVQVDGITVPAEWYVCKEGN